MPQQPSIQQQNEHRRQQAHRILDLLLKKSEDDGYVGRVYLSIPITRGKLGKVRTEVGLEHD